MDLKEIDPKQESNVQGVRLLFVLFLIPLVVLALSFSYMFYNSPDLVGLRPYSFLQGAEAYNRNSTQDLRILYQKDEEFCAGGIRQEKGRVWVLLNHSDGINGVYILGNENYSLIQLDYDEMEKVCKIDPQVSIELKKHLK